MPSINILNYALLSSSGDASATLKAIKSAKVSCSTKEINRLDGKEETPYFLFEKHINDEKYEITEAIKKVVKELTNPLNVAQLKDTALLIGTALIDKNVINAVEDTQNEYEKNPSQFSKTSLDSYAQDIAKELGMNSFSMSVATACTSSINAVIEASNLINAGVVQRAVVLGVEVVSDMMSDGFASMNLLSQTTQKPFDTSRDGLILGEAIAAVLLSKEESPWSILGAYSNCNSHTITSVSESGEEFQEVMQNAMSVAKVSADEISAIKAHATSSLSNDLAEINAISRLFDKGIDITALKPYVGHTLGACGVLEMALMMACVDDGFIPKTLNTSESILSDYAPLEEELVCKDGIFMLNYFGFGGNNTTAIIKKEKQ